MQAYGGGDPDRDTQELKNEIERLKALYKDVREDMDKLAEIIIALVTKDKRAAKKLL